MDLQRMVVCIKATSIPLYHYTKGVPSYTLYVIHGNTRPYASRYRPSEG